MATLISILVVLIIIVGGSIHSYLVIKERVQLPPAAWLSFVLGMSVSYWLYWQKPGASIAANPAQFSAAIEIAVVFCVLWFKLWRDGRLWENLISHKDQFALGVLAVTTAVVWWVLVTYTTLNHETVSRISFFVSQSLTIAGYIGTFLKFLRMKENHDSLAAWFCIFLSSLLGIYPAFVFGDGWSMINAVRATAAGALTFGFFVGLDAANGRFKKSA